MASTRTGVHSSGDAMSVASSFHHTLESAFQNFSKPVFAIRFWDNSIWTNCPAEQYVFELWLRNGRALEFLLKHPEDSWFGKAFLNGDFCINGDLPQALAAWPELKARLRARLGLNMGSLRERGVALQGALSRLLHRGQKHSKVRDKVGAASAFDYPAEFFRTFLGDPMMYSSGRFTEGTSDLAAAQTLRLDNVARKLAFDVDITFVDIGCGWGALALYAAKEFGVRTRGITWSREQARHGIEEAEHSGLAVRCRIDQRDYRDLDIIHLPFERASSLGILEHVGRKNIDLFFTSVSDTLVPRGLFLLETCTGFGENNGANTASMDQFLFPDREFVSLDSIVGAAKRAGLEVQDTEDLGHDYVRTLRCWLEALTANEERLAMLVGKPALRSWKLTLASTAAGFVRQELAAYDVLFKKERSTRRATVRHEDDYVLG